MTITAKVIEDSISSERCGRIVTLQLTYPRFIHSEFMTHRVFSRNASSSRAIPVSKMIDNILENPAEPIHWGKNQPGMQAHEELEQPNKIRVESLWSQAMDNAVLIAKKMMDEGAHKQVINRILEPFQHIHVVVTGTEFTNFFALRDHADAQPEIRQLARTMRLALMNANTQVLKFNEWHLPYVTQQEREEIEDTKLLRNISAARCCRVSYLKHDNSTPSVEDDLALCDKLTKSVPHHSSPFEHQATPDYMTISGYKNRALHGNFVGWIQNRKLMEAEGGY